MQKKLKLRKGATVPSLLTWPSTNKSDGTENIATTGSVDSCSILPETQFVRTMHGHLMDFIRRGFPILMKASRLRPEFHIKPPLGAPLIIFSQGYLLKSFPQRDTPQDSGVSKSVSLS